MINYDGVNATIRSIVPNPINKKFAVIVEAEEKYYQIKFCEVGHKNNINEFIAHYIAKLIDAPVLDGIFLKISDEELDKLKLKMSLFQVFNNIDTDISKDNFFFGVEWMKNVNEIKTPKELMPQVIKTKNKDTFFSLYSLDQILKNYDRHLGNHLISKQKNALVYNLIDFDRIFHHTTWQSLPFLIDDYNCLKTPSTPNQFNQIEFLYSLVNNSNHNFVVNYSAKLSNIKDEDIADLCELIKKVYSVTNDELGKILQWFQTRKERILNKCLDNSDCFTNVSYQRLKNVYRQNISTT